MAQLMTYVPGDTFFHRLHPLTKLSWAVLMCACCFITDNVWFLSAVALSNLLIAAAAGILREAKPVFRLFFIISAMLFVVQALTVRSGDPLFSLGSLPVTTDGLLSAAVFSLRMFAALVPITLTIMLTSTNALSSELVRRLRVPYRFVFILTTALRFIPTLSHELDSVMQAQISRGHELDTKNPIRRLLGVVPLTVPLLVSSVRRSGYTAISLETRGFGLGPRSSYHEYGFHARDVLFLLLTAAALAASVLLAVL